MTGNSPRRNGFSGASVSLTELRCQTEDVAGTGLTRAAVEAAIARAAAAGHVLEDELVSVPMTKTIRGYASRCSCGWQSSRQSKKIRAFRLGFVHLGECIGEDVMGSTGGGVGGLSPDRPERSTTGAKRRSVSGEGEPSSHTSTAPPVTVAAH
jgi:hypothetical protein